MEAIVVAMAVQAGLSLAQGVMGYQAAKQDAKMQAIQIDLDRSARDAEASQEALDNVKSFRAQMATNEALFASKGAAAGVGTSQAFAEESFNAINETLQLSKVKSNNINASANLSKSSAIAAGRHRANMSLIQGVSGAIGAFTRSPVSPAGQGAATGQANRSADGTPIPVKRPSRS